jgi:hypothetical protein
MGRIVRFQRYYWLKGKWRTSLLNLTGGGIIGTGSVLEKDGKRSLFEYEVPSWPGLRQYLLERSLIS